MSTLKSKHAKLPEPPDTLSTEAKRIYNKIGKYLSDAGLLSVIDIKDLILLAKQLSELKKLEQALQINGFTVKNARELINKNPLFKLIYQYRTSVMRSKL